MIDASFVIKLLLAPPINSIEFRSTDGSSLKFGAIFFSFILFSGPTQLIGPTQRCQIARNRIWPVAEN